MARLNYKEVLKGDKGTTFTPYVTQEGLLYWKNDGGLINPTPVNIQGKQGEQGEIGRLTEEQEQKIDRVINDYNDAISNLTNGNESATNSEIVQARNGEVNLNSRLDKFDSQLEHIEKNLNFVNINSLGMFAGENITADLNSYLNNIDCEVALYFPPGVYYIDNIINLPKNIKIYGEKELSIIKANSNKFRIYLNDNVIISNLTIDGGKDILTDTSTRLIACNSEGVQIKNIVIENCNIGNMNTSTFCFGVTIANAKNVIIRNCNFDYFNVLPNSIIGDQNGTARSILISSKTDDCLIEDCSFSGMFNNEDSDHIHVNLGNDGNHTNVYPYNHEGRFNNSNVIIRNNVFSGCMKSAVKVQCSGVIVSDNVMHLLEDFKTYGSIRVQNSSDCIIRNNTTYIDEDSKLESVYTVQFAENTVVDNNTVIFKMPNSDTSDIKPSIYYFYQVEKLIANNLNIIGDYNIRNLINLSGDNGYINISNINYNNYASILNIIYIEKNTDKTNINLNNINIFASLNDYPILYLNTSNKGIIKLNNVIINTQGSFSGKFKAAYLRGSNEVYINNASINEKIDLGSCEKVVIDNSKFNGLIVKSSKLDMLIDNCRFYENYNRDNVALHLGLGEGKEYNIKVLNCIANCGNMFTIGALSDTDKIETPTGVCIESIGNLMCEQAIQDKTFFIRSANSVTIPYSIFKLKTNQFLSGNITRGYYSSKKDINYLSGSLFLDDLSTNTDKGLYISNGEDLIKIG